MKCEKCGFDSKQWNKQCPICGGPSIMSDGGRCTPIEADPGFASRDSEYIGAMVQPMGRVPGSNNRSGEGLVEWDWQNNLQESGQDNKGRHSHSEEGEESSGDPKRTSPYRELLKSRLLLGFAVLFAVGLLIYGLYLKNKPVTVFYEHSSRAIQSYTLMDQTLILNRKGEIVHSFNQPVYVQYCTDKSAGVAYMMKQEEVGLYELYYISDQGSVPLTEDVQVFDMSANGRYLIYSKKITNDEFGLYRYDSKTGKDDLLIKEEGKIFGLVRVSPDAKTITYTLVAADNSSTEIETYLKEEGRDPEFLGDDKVAFAVSNRAKYLYYCDYEDNVISAIYVLKDGMELKLADEFSYTIWFNQDNSEVLYTDGGNTYLYDGSDKIITVAETVVTEIILPHQYRSADQMKPMSDANNVGSFQNKLIRFRDQTLRMMNREYEAEVVCRVDEVSQIALSKDGNNLLYSTAKGSIKKVSDISGARKETTLVNQMNSFITAGNLSQVYYLIGDELFYKEGNNEAKRLAEGAFDLMSNGDYSAALFKTNRTGGRGMMYYSVRGSEPEQLFDGYYVENSVRLDYGWAVMVAKPGGYENYYNPGGRSMLRLEVENK